jgi:hypothetical protein
MYREVDLATVNLAVIITVIAASLDVVPKLLGESPDKHG